MLWKKHKTEKKIEVMHDLLKKSFSNVKTDTGKIFQWLNYFYRKNLEQEHMIRRLQMELSYLPKTREEIRKIVDDYYSFEGMMAKFRDLHEKVDTLSRKMDSSHHQIQQQIHGVHREQVSPTKTQIEHVPSEVKERIESIHDRLQKLEQKKHSMKEKILKKITKNSKDYVKSVIVSYIRKYERISALQLKEIIVDEQAFCSKSSFYRLLEEIEQSEEIAVIKEGKEKHYLMKGARRMSE